jgi:hypothetical protein
MNTRRSAVAMRAPCFGLAIPRDTVKTVRPEVQQPVGKEIRKRVEKQSSHDSGRITGQS